MPRVPPWFEVGFLAAWVGVWLLLAVPSLLPASHVPGLLPVYHAQGLLCSRPFSVLGTTIRVIDGDTLTMRLAIWLGLEQQETIRVLGVDTPELRGPDRVQALAAKRFTEAWLAAATALTISVCARDSFGRLLAVVERDAGESLAAALIRAGHGVKR